MFFGIFQYRKNLLTMFLYVSLIERAGVHLENYSLFWQVVFDEKRLSQPSSGYSCMLSAWSFFWFLSHQSKNDVTVINLYFCGVIVKKQLHKLILLQNNFFKSFLYIVSRITSLIGQRKAEVLHLTFFRFFIMGQKLLPDFEINFNWNITWSSIIFKKWILPEMSRHLDYFLFPMHSRYDICPTFHL